MATAAAHFHFVAHSNGQTFIRRCNASELAIVCNHFRLTVCHDIPNVHTGVPTKVHSPQPPFRGLTQLAVVGLAVLSEDDAKAIVDTIDDPCRVSAWLRNVDVAPVDEAQRQYARADHPFADLERKCSRH